MRLPWRLTNGDFWGVPHELPTADLRNPLVSLCHERLVTSQTDEEGLVTRIVRGDSLFFLAECADYLKRYQPTLLYALLLTLEKVADQTAGRSGGAGEDNPPSVDAADRRQYRALCQRRLEDHRWPQVLEAASPVKRSCEWVSDERHFVITELNDYSWMR